MSVIDWNTASDEDKLGMLQLMYARLKEKAVLTDKDKHHKELIIQETQRVYARLRGRN